MKEAVLLFVTLLSSCIAGSLGFFRQRGNVFAECFEDDQFLAIDREVDFKIAKSTCVAEGGFLARISSQEEHDFVVAFLNSIDEIAENAKFWIGVEDINGVGGNNAS